MQRSCRLHEHLNCRRNTQRVVHRGALALRSFGRLGSSIAVLDFLHLGSSLALRSFGRLGSGLAVLDFLHLGSALALRSFGLRSQLFRRHSKSWVEP